MRVTAKLAEYAPTFNHVRFDRDEHGVLVVSFHSNGGEAIWDFTVHEEIAAAWDHIARDPDNRVIIVTGTGGSFLAHESLEADEHPFSPETWHRLHNVGRRLIESHLDIEVPMIAAVNGNATLHAEQALLCDIVLCVPESNFGEPHVKLNFAPGDGVHVIWPLLAGLNRARYLSLTGQTIDAAEAQRIGLVNEVVPAPRLLARARELAAMLAEKPDTLLRTTRMLYTHQLKSQIHQSLGFGFMAEALAFIDMDPERKPSS